MEQGRKLYSVAFHFTWCTRIFVNVRQLCQQEQERVLIIYGAGHKWVLDEIFDGSPEFTVVQPFGKG